MCDKNPVCGTYSPTNDVWSICNSCRQKLIKGGEQTFYALLTLYNASNGVNGNLSKTILKCAMSEASAVIKKHGNIMPKQYKG